MNDTTRDKINNLILSGNEVARNLRGSPGIDTMRSFDLRKWREAVEDVEQYMRERPNVKGWDWLERHG
jgi:hypothetical protein